MEVWQKDKTKIVDEMRWDSCATDVRKRSLQWFTLARTNCLFREKALFSFVAFFSSLPFLPFNLPDTERNTNTLKLPLYLYALHNCNAKLGRAADGGQRERMRAFGFVLCCAVMWCDGFDDLASLCRPVLVCVGRWCGMSGKNTALERAGCLTHHSQQGMEYTRISRLPDKSNQILTQIASKKIYEVRKE